MAEKYVYVFEQTRHIAIEANSENEAREKLHRNDYLTESVSREKMLGKLKREKEID